MTTALPARPAASTAEPTTIADSGSAATKTTQPMHPTTFNAVGQRRCLGGCVNADAFAIA